MNDVPRMSFAVLIQGVILGIGVIAGIALLLLVLAGPR